MAHPLSQSMEVIPPRAVAIGQSQVDGQEAHKVKAPEPGKHDLKSWWRMWKNDIYRTRQRKSATFFFLLNEGMLLSINVH